MSRGRVFTDAVVFLGPFTDWHGEWSGDVGALCVFCDIPTFALDTRAGFAPERGEPSAPGSVVGGGSIGRPSGVFDFRIFGTCGLKTLF